MSDIEVTNETAAAVDVDWAVGLLEGVMAREERSVRLHAVIVDDETIRRVHKEFHDDDTPTDVISFPLDDSALDPSALDQSTLDQAGDPPVNWDPEGEGPAAEIVVSADTAEREASRRGISFESELALYLIHGTLHILGYDDIDDVDRAKMREAESRHLDAAGYPPDLYDRAD